MVRSRKVFSYAKRMVLGLLVGLLLLGVISYAALPWLSQTVLTPMIREALGASEFTMDVRRLNLGGLDLGQVSLGPEIGLGLKAVQVDWSWSDLIQGRLQTIQVHGLELELQETESGWSIPGLALPAGADNSGEQFFLPQVDQILVAGELRIHGLDFHLDVPFVVNGTLNAEELAILEVRTALAGQELRVQVEAVPRTKNLRLSGNLTGASVAALASLVPQLNFPVSGLLNLQADLSSLTKAQSTVQLDGAQALVAGQYVNQAQSTTIIADWDGQQVSAQISPLSLLAPWPLELELSQVRFQLNADESDSALFACDWALQLEPPASLGFVLPLSLKGDFHLWRKNNGLQAQVQAVLDPVQLDLSDGIQGSLETASLRCDLRMQNNIIEVEGVLDSGPLSMTHGGNSLNMAGLELTTKAFWDEVAGFYGEAQVATARVTGKSEEASFALPAAQAAVFFAQNGTVGNGTLSTQAHFIAADLSGGVTLQLPLAWPEPTAKLGQVSANLAWKKKNLAKVSTRLRQEPTGYALDGQLSVLPLNVKTSLQGQINYFAPKTSWLKLTAGQGLVLPGGLSDFVPALADLKGTAKLELSTRLDLSSGSLQMPVVLQLTDMSLEHASSKIALQGGKLGFKMQNALDLRSDPDQHLAFDLLQLGAVRLEQGDLRYQMEGLRSFLVEGFTLNWAGGRVGTQSFRINPSVEDYRVELYCDRVQLARALEQLGMTQVQGGGTANGRIPLRYANGSLTFEDGFLYSTPGEAGVLQVQGADVLTAGVLPQSAQFGQLELAVEALKEFAYEWAKISMNTEGHELVVALELDGKPAQPLPFVYDQTIGGFARVTAASPGSVFQGIHLNVNFRLPLDQLLQYRHVLELMNKGG